MFYGFRSPGKREVVFHIAGDAQEVRFLDRAVRWICRSAVQSTIRDGIRHKYASLLDFIMWRLAAGAARCKIHRVLRLLAPVLTALLFLATVLAVRAENADFSRRKFVRDNDGNFTLMFTGADKEHHIRGFVSQMGFRIVSEKFPPGAYRVAKPEVRSQSTYKFTVGGRTTVLTLDHG